MQTGERVPPHSTFAEQNVLGAMLLDEEARVKAVRILTDQDFYIEQHRIIFNAIIITKNPDIATVADTLEGKVKQAGTDWIEYLTTLVSMVNTTAAIETHSNIVKTKSQYRQFITSATKVIDAAMSASEPILDLKGKAFELFDIKTDTAQGKHISQAATDYLALLEHRRKTPGYDIKTGIPWLDRHTGGFPNGTSNIIAARPSVGKTTLAVQIFKHNAFKGKRPLLFSLEMPEDQIMDKIVANSVGIDAYLLSNPNQLNEREQRAIEGATKELAALDLMIYDNVMDIEEIKAIAKQEKAEHGVNLVVIDYLQIVRCRSSFDGENAKLTYISQELMALAKVLQCPIITLSQLKRLEGPKNPEPVLSDLRGSGSIEQDAYMVFLLHDPHAGDCDTDIDQNDADLKVIIAKNRGGQRDIATILRYQKPTQRIMERAMPSAGTQPRPQQGRPPQQQSQRRTGRQTQSQTQADGQEDLPW